VSRLLVFTFFVAVAAASLARLGPGPLGSCHEFELNTNISHGDPYLLVSREFQMSAGCNGGEWGNGVELAILGNSLRTRVTGQ